MNLNSFPNHFAFDSLCEKQNAKLDRITSEKHNLMTGKEVFWSNDGWTEGPMNLMDIFTRIHLWFSVFYKLTMPQHLSRDNQHILTLCWWYIFFLMAEAKLGRKRKKEKEWDRSILAKGGRVSATLIQGKELSNWLSQKSL